MRAHLFLVERRGVALMDDLAADRRTLDLFISRRLAQMAQQENPPQRLLLIVDQFEALPATPRMAIQRKIARRLATR